MPKCSHLLAVVALLLAACFGVFRQNFFRIYVVLTMFRPDQIHRNFRSLSDPSLNLNPFPYRTAAAGAAVAPFREPIEGKPLPREFVHKGEVIQMEEWMHEFNTTGLVVLRIVSPTEAVIEHQEYRLGNDASSSCVSWSVGKSVVGTLVGMALEDQLIHSLQDKITDYLPQLRDSGYDNVPIQHILTMSSGVAFTEDYGDFYSDINRMGRLLALGQSIQTFSASLRAQRKPGTYLKYVSIDTQVLGLLLSQVLLPSNRTLTQYLGERLWQPIGMEGPVHWSLDNDKDRMELAFGTLHARTRDYARFGWFQLNKGLSPLDSSRLLSASWVEASCHPESAEHLQAGNHKFKDQLLQELGLGYGYHWWCPPHPTLPNTYSGEHMASGVYGQAIYVNFHQNIVIARNAAFAKFTAPSQRARTSSSALAAFRTIATHYAAV
eukprot:gb/GEZN01007553.1/.p1 GENE.gb/GEZN01007553.1/~~gb/GEZN01007553.1/.p1  ORF type:complete len:445 (+),score=20.07 gb/GEZN01007553.1/:30-1337(+)